MFLYFMKFASLLVWSGLCIQYILICTGDQRMKDNERLFFEIDRLSQAQPLVRQTPI
jgi:hypothetical protein